MSQATYSEMMLGELMKIAEEQRVSLFEAAGEYCSIHDLDEYEFIKKLDKHAIDQIKTSALTIGAVRKCVETPPPTLF